MPVADAEPLPHDAGSQIDFLRKHLLIADPGKAKEERFGMRGTLTMNGLERLVDSIRLLEQSRLTCSQQVIGHGKVRIARTPHVGNRINRIAQPYEYHDE